MPGEDLLTTSTQFLDLDALPRRIVFAGGGYIAFEFSHIAARGRTGPGAPPGESSAEEV
jgi:glutathione reductase (NADPH)